MNGVDEDFAFYLVSIANAASMLGRLAAGYLADKVGKLSKSMHVFHVLVWSVGAINVMAPFTCVAGILTYIWPFVYGKTAYIIVAVIYGYVCPGNVQVSALTLVFPGCPRELMSH